jgi:thiol-disulfide isomerase/thioredoxin
MNLLQRRRIVSAIGATVLALALPAARATPGEVMVGGTVPDGALDGLNGPARRMVAFRGRPLLVNLWASWCGPCVEEMASLERLAWLDRRPDFVLIGISTDDYRDRALAQLRRANATISHFLDDAQRWENLLGADRIPDTVLLDARGRVLAKYHGSREWDSPQTVAMLARVLGSRKDKATAT